MNIPKNFQEVPWVKVGVVVATVALLAIFSSALISAAIGGASLMILGIIGLIGVALIKSTSYFGQKLDNKILALRKAEAQKNPIEQKQNEYKRRQGIFEERERMLAAENTEIRNLEDMLRTRKRDNPNQDLSRAIHDLDMMKKAHNRRVEKYKTALIGQERFAKDIEEEIFQWKYSQASKKIREGMKKEHDATAEILTQEATLAIRSEYNRSFAEMDMEFATDSVASSPLQYNPSESLDVIDTQAKVVTPISRLEN